MGERVGDWQRLESVIEWANMTTNYFARYIGLSRGENLYQIKRGNNGISRKIAQLIVDKFPEISMLWLLTGDGQMLMGAENASGSIPFFNVGVEESIRMLSTLDAESQLVLPPMVDCDMAMNYFGRAMGDLTPTNTVLLLKKILPEMIIPGDECVIVTKKIVLLRIAKIESSDDRPSRLRLVAINSEIYGDVVVSFDEVEAVYIVKGKILINR